MAACGKRKRTSGFLTFSRGIAGGGGEDAAGGQMVNRRKMG